MGRIEPAFTARNNLDGDALNTPVYNCGDHYCGVGDCQWHFERSSAYSTCQGEDGATEPTYTISASDGSSQTCKVSASCSYRHDNGNDYGRPWRTKTTVTAGEAVWDLGELVNCHGTLGSGTLLAESVADGYCNGWNWD